MRIIAGEKRGLKLAILEGTYTRPTKDSVREAIFSRLQFYIKDCQVLDLFAGTGAMGLEALSRGAKEVIFVDNNLNALKVLKKNIILAKYEEKAHIYSMDALEYLKGTKSKFDIIFLDPPYMDGYYSKVLNLIIECDVLIPDGLVVIESKKNTLFLQESSLFLMEKERTYGKTTVTYLRKK